MLRTTLISILSALILAALLAGAAAAAPAPSTAPVPVYLVDLLTKIYRGDDGSALYLRQQGNDVYGFGEHPGKDYAYVLKGKLVGDTIFASWWDVPKGDGMQEDKKKRSVQLRWSQLGNRIVRAGGDGFELNVFTAIPPSGIPWPNRQAAGFQATKQNDLTGSFDGDDGSRHYFTEVGGEVVGVAERGAQPEERPGWVTVFFGTRKSNGAVGGIYVDVPKGLELKSGAWGAALLGSKRELFVDQTSVDRTRSLTPEYTIDWDGFAAEIARNTWGSGTRVVGYAYAIARHGAILRYGAGGDRRTAKDGGRLPFTTKTQAQTASTAKTINAAAIIKALYDRGLTVDTKVAPFLPSCWERGKDVATLTFRQILSHTSGLPKAGSACNFGDGYQCLLDMIKKGRIASKARIYNTHAYDLLRILVPMVVDRDKTKGHFELFKCKNTAGILNGRVSERFARYVFDEILDPAGARASYYPTGDFSYNYDEDRRQLKGDKPRHRLLQAGGEREAGDLGARLHPLPQRPRPRSDHPEGARRDDEGAVRLEPARLRHRAHR